MLAIGPRRNPIFGRRCAFSKGNGKAPPHSEGYVNEYELSQLGADAKSLEFVTTSIENLPGFRAKKVYRIVSTSEIEEAFYLAQPGKDFEIYTTSNLRRVK
jgi:hypothetical protein